MKTVPDILERTILALTLMVLLVPLPLTIYFQTRRQSDFLEFLSNRGLSQAVKPMKPLTAENLMSAGYQTSLLEHFNDVFAGRKALLRVANESYFRICGTSLNRAHLIGKNRNIYSTGYLQEYYRDRVAPSEIENLAKDLKSLQDICAKRGIAFVFLLTPSKASAMREFNPPAWEKLMDPRPRAVNMLVPRLQKHGVHFVNGSLLTEKAKSISTAPVFPQGGIHWNTLVALQSTNALIREFSAQGKKAPVIEPEKVTLSDEPLGRDKDVLDIISPIIPWRYPCVRVHFKTLPPEKSSNLKVAMVGGSFAEDFCAQFSAVHPSSIVSLFFYYTTNTYVFHEKERRKLPNKQRINVNKDIFETDVLLLECNERVLVQPASHIRTFLADALSHAGVKAE